MFLPKIGFGKWQLDEKCYRRMLGTPIIHMSECIRCQIIFPPISLTPDIHALPTVLNERKFIAANVHLAENELVRFRALRRRHTLRQQLTH